MSRRRRGISKGSMSREYGGLLSRRAEGRVTIKSATFPALLADRIESQSIYNSRPGVPVYGSDVKLTVREGAYVIAPKEITKQTPYLASGLTSTANTPIAVYQHALGLVSQARRRDLATARPGAEPQTPTTYAEVMVERELIMADHEGVGVSIFTLSGSDILQTSRTSLAMATLSVEGTASVLLGTHQGEYYPPGTRLTWELPEPSVSKRPDAPAAWSIPTNFADMPLLDRIGFKPYDPLGDFEVHDGAKWASDTSSYYKIPRELHYALRMNALFASASARAPKAVPPCVSGLHSMIGWTGTGAAEDGEDFEDRVRYHYGSKDLYAISHDPTRKAMAIGLAEESLTTVDDTGSKETDWWVLEGLVRKFRGALAVHESTRRRVVGVVHYCYPDKGSAHILLSRS